MADIIKIKAGQVYKHYKGNYYLVIGIGVHSEDLDDYVIYKPLYDVEEKFKGKLWLRPLKMFCSDVEVEGKKVPRFNLTT